MNIVQINQQSVSSFNRILKPMRSKEMKAILQPQVLNQNYRRFLQCNSELKNLNSIDYFNGIDTDPIGDLEFFDSYLSGAKSGTVPPPSGNGPGTKVYFNSDELKRKAMDLVIGMTLVNGFAGFATAQLGVASWGILVPVVGMMCSRIADIYEVSLRGSALEGLKGASKILYRDSLAAGIISHFPLIGNFSNTVSAVLMTQIIGRNLVNKFDSAQRHAHRELEWYREKERLLEENEYLQKRQELINKYLEQIIENEKKGNL